MKMLLIPRALVRSSKCAALALILKYCRSRSRWRSQQTSVAQILCSFKAAKAMLFPLKNHFFSNFSCKARSQDVKWRQKLRNIFRIFIKETMKMYLKGKKCWFSDSDERKKWSRICARARLILHALPLALMGPEFGCGPARARPSWALTNDTSGSFKVVRFIKRYFCFVLLSGSWVNDGMYFLPWKDRTLLYNLCASLTRLRDLSMPEK